MPEITNFSVTPLSMVTHDDRQRVKLTACVSRTCHVTLEVYGEDVLLASCDAAFTSGESTQFVFLPVREKDTHAHWQLVRGGEVLAETDAVWTAPRPWKIYMMISSHTDIGLHNSQYIQRFQSSRFLDKAAALCDETADRPENDRYRYTIEGTWFWNNYPADRGTEAARRLIDEYIQKGKIGIYAGIAGNHTQTYGLEEMCRAAGERDRLRREWGLNRKSLSMIDNNGMSWALVQPFADAGYENIFFAPNQWNPLPSTVWPADTAIDAYTWNPEAGGGGSRVDVRTDSGLPQLFWWESPDGKHRLLVWSSTQYDRGGYVFGLPPHAQPTAEAIRIMEQRMAIQLPKLEARYPLDLWLGADYCDDEEPTLNMVDLFALWNAKWKVPTFRALGNPDAVFDEVRARFGSRIPVLRGEMTGGWYQHPVSAAELLARKLNADRALATAEKLSALAGLSCGEYRYPAEDFRRAWDALLWNDEHSYGTSGYQGRRVYETWMQHRDWIEKAETTARKETREALGALVSRIPGKGICVFNPTAHARSEFVLWQGQWAWAENIPPMGYRVLPDSVFSADDVAETALSEPPVIENDFYRIRFAETGAMSSIYDKQLGRELLDSSKEGANCLLYTADNHISFACPHRATFTLSAPPIGITVTARTDEPVSGTSVTQTVTLPRGEKRIEIRNDLRHVRDMVNTNRYYRYLYYAFPFAVPNPRRFCQLNGCEAEYARDLTGHGTDTYMAAHEWCCAENGDFGVGLILRDSQLVEFDHIHPDKTDCDAAGSGSAIYNYIANDWLQMHLTGGSELAYTLRYAITSYAGHHTDAGLARTAEDFCFPPLTVPLPGNGDGTLPGEEHSFLTVPAGQRLVGLKRAEDGRGVIAHLLGDQRSAAICSEYGAGCAVTVDERERTTPLSGRGFSAFRLAEGRSLPLREPEPDITDESIPAPVGSVYTGLITAPRAFRGENSGHLYLLWGANMEKNLSHYELYRAEVSGFTPDKATFLAKVKPEDYRVGRYADEGLKPYCRYFYRVRAVNTDGRKGPFSREFSGTTKEE